jgi:putative ATP-binding cassette transporter
MKLFQFLLARSRRTLFLAIVFGLLSGMLNSGLLAVVNRAIASQGKSFSGILLIFAGLCLLACLARLLSEVLLIFLGQDSILTLRSELSRHVLSVPLRRLEQLGKHRILSVLTDDIPGIGAAVGLVPLICINAGVVLGCIAFMWWLNGKLLLAALTFIVLGILTYQAVVARAAAHLKRAREHDNHLQNHFQSLIHGIKELKLHQRRREAFHSDVLRGAAQQARSSNVAGLRLYSAASSWGQLLAFLAIGLTVFFLAGVLHASISVLTGVSMALLYLMTPLQVIMNSVPALERANIAIANAGELGFELMHSQSPDEDAAAVKAPQGPIRLELSGITYSYRKDGSEEGFTLGPLDLVVDPGELLFITGGNGSGKTTLAKLIVGLYVPDSGELRCNGQLVTEETRDAYRQCFATVFSDFFLFDSLLGLEGVQLDQRANEYLSSLQLEHKVSVKNGRLSAIDLSQGQRKRLALLTACLEDRPICFFDEWAADQDPVFKAAFYFDILPSLRARNKTVIIISHDEQYYGVADRILNLNSGCLIPSISPSLELKTFGTGDDL